ncbi:hypothetical protein K503DRAFT_694562 [Rhizopogon vinicolor AM-OR11-026]|uniref:Uncharacterized protein n=1 Tax=Rhizopogon vinicolor AM-OR11-026 TaxID=1314800 RepID=A0A1B7MVY0_9AGAM|nr:hypothetical protein K503DRAFT_694562 [Rhizopogon vinicolor AM-OR11-026]
MVDWKSQEELAKDAIVFVKLNHTLFGLYIWEFVISLDFDWAVLTRKKKFRWPLIFYFANRYFLLFSMIGTSIAYDSTSKLDCRALYTFDELSGVAAVGLASINLSLRTVAIWSHNKWIIMLLVAIVIGHWSLILRGALVVGVWVPGVGCQITHSNTTILSATFIYSMCFDFIVMCLSAYKLAPMRRGMQGAHSQLIGMLFTDGLIYFITAFVANLLAATFMLLELNTIMSVIFNVPAATASTIVACRVVRRLADFQPSGPELL